MFDGHYFRKLISVTIIVLLLSAGIVILLPTNPIIQNAEAASVWVQITDTDFANGTLDNLTIVSNETSIGLRLISESTDSWTDKTTGNKPTASSVIGLAQIYGTDQVVLYGGVVGDSPSRTYYNETWIYNLSLNQWTFKNPINKIRGLWSYFGMTSIYGTKNVIVFGGIDENSIEDSNETWIYNVTTNSWIEKTPLTPTPTNNPGERSGPVISLIHGTDKVLLFGGTWSLRLNDTWIYNYSSNTWTEKFPTGLIPSAREGHAMAPIYGTDKVLLFGGYSPLPGNSNETWIYDLSDNTWTLKSPKNIPPGRMYHAMASIPGTDKILMFGSTSNKTWIYDLSDNSWTKKDLNPQPTKRGLHAMTSIWEMNKVLLYGGNEGAGIYDRDIWLYKWSPYVNNGTYISASNDTGDNSLFKTISWNGTLLSGNNLKIQVRTAKTEVGLNSKNFVGPDGTISTNYTIKTGESIWGGHNGDRWLQIKAYLATTNKNETPSLDDILIFYNNIANTILLIPVNQSIITNNQPTFNWNFIDLDSSQQAAFQVLIDDNSDFSSIEYNSGINSSAITQWQFPSGTSYTEINDGTWFWKVRTKDNDGDWGPYSGFNIVIIDTTAPLNFTPIATPSSWTNNTQPIITFSTTDATSGINHYEVKIDSGIFTTQTSPFVLPAQTNGIHNITVRAFDNASNYVDRFVDIYIDTINPNSFTPMADPSGWTNNTQPVVSFSTLDGTSGIDHYEVKIDSGIFSTQTSPYTLPAQIDGIHNITVRAFDNAGNYVDGFVDIFIDTNYPESFTPTADPSGWTNNTQPIISFSTTDGTSGIDHYEVKIDTDAFSIQNSPYTLPPQTDGIHNITVRAFDISGKYTDGYVDIYIDTNYPESFTPTTDPSGWTSNTQPIISFSTIDSTSGIDYYEVKIDEDTFSTQISPYTLPSQSDGIHNITVRAYDKSGKYTDGFVDIFIDTVPPPITHTPITTSTKGFPITISAVVSDENSGIDRVELFFKKQTDSSYSVLLMNFEDQIYSSVIPAGSITEDGIEYYIKATDKTSPANVNYYGYNGETALEPGPMTDIDIAISSKDQTPPTITHIPVTNGNIGKPITISATVIDDVSGIDNVELYYKKKSDSSYSNISMSKFKNSYSAEIPAIDVTTDGIEYFIEAADKASPSNIAYFGANGQVLSMPNSLNDIDIQVTEKDTIPPTILEKSPTGDNVPVGTTITITFSESMDKTTVEDAFSITPMVSGTFSWSGNILIYTLDKALNYGTKYNVTIGGGAKDLANNNLTSETNWGFTTTSVIDTTPPTVDEVYPEGSNVAIDSTITITFSEPMLQVDTESAFSILPNINGTFQWIGEILLFTPDSPLDLTTQYKVTISPEAKDLVGNSLSPEYFWYFTTVSVVDITPPTVSDFSPTGSNVPIDTEIRIIFSEPMAKIDTEAAFFISPSINGTFSWTENTLILTPNQPLDYNTRYEITLTMDAKDLGGISLEKAEHWSFTTIKEPDDDKDKGLFGLGKIGGIDIFLLLIMLIIIIILIALVLRRKKPEEEVPEEEEEEPEEEELEEEAELEEEIEEEEPELEEELEDFKLIDDEELEAEIESKDEIDLALFEDTELAVKSKKTKKPEKGIAPKKGKIPEKGKAPKKPEKPKKPLERKGKAPEKPKRPEPEELELKSKAAPVLGAKEVEKEIEPKLVKLTDKSVQCGICLGVIKTGLMAIKCKCGKKYHESCGVRVGECPKCERKFILEKLAKLKPEEIEELEEKEESELSPKEFKLEKEKKEKEKLSEFAEILKGLEKRLAKGEISEETYLMLRKKYENK